MGAGETTETGKAYPFMLRQRTPQFKHRMSWRARSSEPQQRPEQKLDSTSTDMLSDDGKSMPPAIRPSPLTRSGPALFRGVLAPAACAAGSAEGGALHALSDAVSTAASVLSAASVLRDVLAKLSELLEAVEECEDDDGSEESDAYEEPDSPSARPASPAP